MDPHFALGIGYGPTDMRNMINVLMSGGLSEVNIMNQ